jgi:hypothetical protein
MAATRLSRRTKAMAKASETSSGPETVGPDHGLLVTAVDVVSGSTGDPPASEGAGEVTLSTGDLIEDANGEVVLFNDSALRTLTLDSDAAAVRHGLAEEHVTATGEDVTGYQFITFDNGLTIYYQPSLEVIVRHEAG